MNTQLRTGRAAISYRSVCKEHQLPIPVVWHLNLVKAAIISTGETASTGQRREGWIDIGPRLFRTRNRPESDRGLRLTWRDAR